MAILQEAHKKLLKEYPRALVHMRAQLKSKRLSVVFGAGLSKPFGLPNWATLVEKIAQDRAVQGQEVLDRLKERGSLPYKTELLFQHFWCRQAKSLDPSKLGSPEFENRTLGKWFGICRKHLYQDATHNFKKALESHVYLARYLPIIQETPITITYNFDDFLEQALFAKRKDTSLGYETVTNPWTQFRRRDAVIYHPHGVLPRQLMEFPKDRLVFSESAYAKLFLGALAGDFSFLLNHMSKNTCLMVGSSLEDEDLRNLLVQSAQANPGNPHYHVYFLEPGKSMPASDAQAIRRANFHVYNLITLFLHEDEIAALADLLCGGYLNDNEFADRLLELGSQSAYRFYLTGALGVGKSAATTQLRNLMVLDEWAEPRLPVLAKSWDQLTPAQKKRADSWVAKQFRIKNDRLRHETFGIALVDRPPMDPLAFTPVPEQPEKANFLLKTICPGGKWEIADGTVILLIGDPKELAARVLSTGRDEYTEKKLSDMERNLRLLYSGEGIRIVETRGRSVAEVTKAVSEIIHFDDYKPFDFFGHLTEIQSKVNRHVKEVVKRRPRKKASSKS
jgi:hypothetical protein